MRLQMRVTGVAPNDVLNVREYPTSGLKLSGSFPPNARGVTSLGEIVEREGAR